MSATGQVIRVASDPAKGTMVLRGVCSCKWASDRVEARDTGTVQGNAPATNLVARMIVAHFKQKHPELSD